MTQDTPHHIYIVDLETTGFNARRDKIVEIGIVILDTLTYHSEQISNKIIRVPKAQVESAWIVQNGKMTLEEIAAGISLDLVKEQTQVVLKNQPWTSYNTAFDYPFLKQWDLKDLLPPKYCIMLRSTGIVPTEWQEWKDEYKWPKLSEAYSYLYGESLSEAHRALQDATTATKILIKLLQLEQMQTFLKSFLNQDKKYPLKITYRDRNGYTTHRMILPKILKEAKLLEAYDYGREEDQRFNLTRIEHLALF